MTPELQAALADVDRVFRGRTCAADNVCLHCYPEIWAVDLSRPGALLHPEFLASVTYEAPGMVDDHDGLVRRILPQMAKAMVDGSLSLFDVEHHALARGSWRTWSKRESVAIRRFIEAWWLDLVTTREPHHGVREAFEAYATMTADLAAALGSWPRGEVATEHFVAVSKSWLWELTHGYEVLHILEAVDEANEWLRQWYAAAGAERLRDAGEPELAVDAERLALDIHERMNLLYGASPEA
ncbi:hypothetical protein WBG06_14150 [Nocardioides sp. CCNWLW239]|uniref:hypothetical protein n=1 Tax=Nocardioides sp. CCNWLW239 TaxID=3128902 RepID=UPI003015F8CE